MQNLLTIELICAASGGFIGAMFAIVFNERKETFIQAVMSLIIGIFAGSGLGTKYGTDPIWCVIIGGIGGSLGGLVLEGLAKAVKDNIPRATQNLIDGWVAKLGGKVEEENTLETPEQDMEPEEK